MREGLHEITDRDEEILDTEPIVFFCHFSELTSFMIFVRLLEDRSARLNSKIQGLRTL